MEKKTDLNFDKDNNELIKLKKEEAKLKDTLKRITEIKENPGKKVFIPLLNNSKIAFFEAKLKGTPSLFTNIGEYVIQTTIDKKINKINKSIAEFKGQINKLNDKEATESINSKLDNQEKIIYNEKQEKIGELKKLNDGLFEIIEDELVSEKIKLELENKTDNYYNIKPKDIEDKANHQDEINKKLEEMKNSKSKYKDRNYVNFADLEFL